MSTTAIAIISILAPIAVGALAYVVRLARQVTALQAAKQTSTGTACEHTRAGLDRIDRQIEAMATTQAVITSTLEAWEKYRWPANEKALDETASAIRELIKALVARLEG